MAAALPWFAFYPGDWVTETARMSPLARAAHIDLLSAVWTGGPVPDDDAMLARCARLSGDEWARVRCELLNIWKVSDDGWSLDWLTAQRVRATERSQQARAAINSRWERQRQTSKEDSHEQTSVVTSRGTDVVHPSLSPSLSPSLHPSGVVVLDRERSPVQRAKGGFFVRKSNTTSQRIFEIRETLPLTISLKSAADALAEALLIALEGYGPSQADRRELEKLLGDDPGTTTQRALGALEMTTLATSKTARIEAPVRWIEGVIKNTAHCGKHVAAR